MPRICFPDEKFLLFPQSECANLKMEKAGTLDDMEEGTNVIRNDVDVLKNYSDAVIEIGYCEINSSNFSVFIVFFFLLGLLVHSFIYDRVRDS